MTGSRVAASLDSIEPTLAAACVGDSPLAREALALARGAVAGPAATLALRRIDLGKTQMASLQDDALWSREPASVHASAVGLLALERSRACADAVAHGNRAAALNALNVALKASDLIGLTAPALRQACRELIDAILALPAAPASSSNPPLVAPAAVAGGAQRRSSLVVLHHEGPIARAYLAALATAGVTPRLIVDLVSLRDVASGEPTARWLPAPLRTRWAAWVQRQRIHHWPRSLAQTHAALKQDMQRALSSAIDLPAAIFDEAAALQPLRRYADDVVTLPHDNLADPRVAALLDRLAPVQVLYTGGGIVPRSLLERPGVMWLHVHPGFLPLIRGSDGALWSELVAGRFSASAFLMAPGIDTGDVLASQWYPAIRFDPQHRSLPPQTLYRALYGFVDPFLRARLLIEVLARSDAPCTLPAMPQPEDAGETFRRMHGDLRALAFARLFGADSAPRH